MVGTWDGETDEGRGNAWKEYFTTESTSSMLPMFLTQVSNDITTELWIAFWYQ